MITVSGNKFTWVNGRGCSEASDLGWQAFPTQFYIKSHKTGKKLLFLVDADLLEATQGVEGLPITYFSPGNNVVVNVFND